MGRVGRLYKENDITLQYRAHGYKLWPHRAATLLSYIIKILTRSILDVSILNEARRYKGTKEQSLLICDKNTWVISILTSKSS
jgi:hypothetical protein